MVFAHSEVAGKIAWHAHYDVWLILGALIAGYVFALMRYRARTGGSGATSSQKGWFAAGIFTLWIASDYPIHDYAETYLFSVHMVQHMLITLVAPPMMILGMPDWMKRQLFCRRGVYGLSKFFFAPLVAALLYNFTTVLTHWPVVVNAALNYHWLHFFIHIWLFATAWAMWMPVVNKMPELPTMSVPMKMIYLFLQSIIPTVPAAFITFADNPVYSFYANAPRVWESFTAVQDQQLAGALMKVVGGGFIWIVIVVVFFSWKGEDGRPRKSITTSTLPIDPEQSGVSVSPN